MTGCMGIFLLVMAALQAWPGRGYWQGSVDGRPGTLAGSIRRMAGTPQPHVLSTSVSWFASVDEGHGWIVNGVAVVLLAAIGVALLVGGRLLGPAVVALAGFALVDWVFIEDIGVWGGTGTDPNSMLPILFVVLGGYLALTTPAPVPAPARKATRTCRTSSWSSRRNAGPGGSG